MGTRRNVTSADETAKTKQPTAAKAKGTTPQKAAQLPTVRTRCADDKGPNATIRMTADATGGFVNRLGQHVAPGQKIVCSRSVAEWLVAHGPFDRVAR